MRSIAGRTLALLALLVAAPPAHARPKRCTDASGFAAAMEAVDAAVPCEDAKNHTQYVGRAGKALRGELNGPCKKKFVRQYIKHSLCGREPGLAVCCTANRKGASTSKDGGWSVRHDDHDHDEYNDTHDGPPTPSPSATMWQRRH